MSLLQQHWTCEEWAPENPDTQPEVAKADKVTRLDKGWSTRDQRQRQEDQVEGNLQALRGNKATRSEQTDRV